MVKKKVYVESSVISWLTANPPNDILKLAKQRQTQMWWERRHGWELFISPTVLLEIQRGDQAAASKRMSAVAGLPTLADTAEINALAGALVEDDLIPVKAHLDAFHIASATVHAMDYLTTWNQTHLFNLDRIEFLYNALRRRGYTPPVLVRPDYFLEAHHGA